MIKTQMKTCQNTKKILLKVLKLNDSLNYLKSWPSNAKVLNFVLRFKVLSNI